MTNELVSVVITTYGRTDFLRAAIDSVIHQTYKNIEIIVVDDNALNLEVRLEVKKIIDEYDSINLVLNEKNLGGSFSRNEGIKVANGSLISFLDDDDYYYPTRIEDYVSAYNNSLDCDNVGIIYGYVDAVDANDRVIGEYKIDLQDRVLFQHMNGCLAATSQWMVPKKVFNDVGMFEDTPCKQDSIMLLKIIGGNYKVICVKKKLGAYREQHNGNRISGISEKKVIGINNFWKWSKKYYNQLTKREQKFVDANFARQLLIVHILLGNKIEAKRNLHIMLKNDPFSMASIKAVVKYLFSSQYKKRLGMK